MPAVVRPVLAFVAGLLTISLVTGLIEFATVVVVNGGVLTEPEACFAIRNLPGVLAAKLVYNTGAAVLGGYVCVLVSRRPLVPWVLAVVQAVSLLWGAYLSEYAGSFPAWLGPALVVVTTGGIFAGARWRLARNAAARAVATPATKAA